MSSPFVAEIRIFAGNFAPTGWATCDGQLMPISQNTALFSLLGTNYGGDGKSTFALPNFRGSAPINQGVGPGLTERFLGEASGVPTVILLQSEIPPHTHTLQGGSAGGLASPAGSSFGAAGRGRPAPYTNTAPTQTMNPLAISVAGSDTPHNNMMPYLGLTFIIALQGVFPPRQ